MAPYINKKLLTEIIGLGGSKKKEEIGNKIRKNKTTIVIVLVVPSIFAVLNSFILVIIKGVFSHRFAYDL